MQPCYVKDYLQVNLNCLNLNHHLVLEDLLKMMMKI